MTSLAGSEAVSALQTFLHGQRLAHLARLDELLRAPEFAGAQPATNAERNLRTYARLAAVGRHEGGSVELAADTPRLNTVQEWMAVVDPCVFHAALVHFAVCTWAIRALGRPGAYLAELTDDLDRQRAAGTILVTEVGRSNSHIALATEARFDPGSRTFNLHTPDDGAAKIMANVAQAGVPKVAIVFAQVVVGERRCGVFAFGMRIQTEHGPAQGVRVAALSDVPAVPLDYALVRFEGARVPFDSWLCDSATIDADGVFEDPLGGSGQRLMRSFAFAAHAALAGSVGLAAAARASVTIALRHANQRVTSGTLAPGLKVIGYSTQQWALYGALADAYAITFLVDDAKVWYRQGTSSEVREGAQTFAPWSAVNASVTLTKAAAAACLGRVTAACRIGAGAQGLLSENRVTQYEGLSQVFQAAAGDSLLSRMDAGKSLVSDADYEVDATRPAGPLDFDDPRTALALCAASEAGLLADIRERVGAADAAATPFDVWNPLLPATIQLADAHLRNLTLRSFDERVRSAVEAEVVEPLRALQLLHGLNVVHEDLAWHLEHGSLTPSDLVALRAARDRALARVHDHGAALVDAFALPPERLRATIGQEEYVSAVARQFDAE
ncbi:MAG: acyl-CoA oxidase [Solirubrobacteraceae bacterium]|nr:acyl-CoA oxidase [Solirubrobacteraceae bacterium]